MGASDEHQEGHQNSANLDQLLEQRERAAFGLALGATEAVGLPREPFERRMEELYGLFAAARPTAVNLFWAIDRMRAAERAARASGLAPQRIAAALEREAQAIA